MGIESREQSLYATESSLFPFPGEKCGLSSPRPANWMWARVAGDGLDLGALGAAWTEVNGEQRGRVLAATAAVAGVTALDILCGVQLSAAAALEG